MKQIYDQKDSSCHHTVSFSLYLGSPTSMCPLLKATQYEFEEISLVVSSNLIDDVEAIFHLSIV